MNARVCAVLVACSVTSAFAQQRGVPENGFPTWQERMLQVLFNRVRAAPSVDPKACAADTVRPPLGWTYNLSRAARFHSANLKMTGCFQHNSPCLLVSDISDRFAPNGTCDGSAACACSNAPACQSSCTSSECTQTFARVAMFGSSGSGEIIAGGYSTPRSATTGWMGSAGHCSIILGSSTSVGTGYVDGTWTGNFGSGAVEGVLIAGGHEVGTSYRQFATSAAQDVAFRVNHYDTAGAPQSARVNVAGTCTPMTLERGTEQNGTWLATVSLSGTDCRRYQFTFKDSAGATVVLPESGSYGVGSALESCPDWDVSLPPSCDGAPQTPANPDAGTPVEPVGPVGPGAPGDAIAPTVRIVSPEEGANVESSFIVVAEASDNVGVTSVAFELDGVEVAVASIAPWQATVGSADLAATDHTLVAVARDAAGNVSRSQVVTVFHGSSDDVGCACGSGASAVAPVLLGVALMWVRLRRRGAC